MPKEKIRTIMVRVDIVNAAFVDDFRSEIRHIFRRIAEKIANEPLDNPEEFSVSDSNGSKVGMVTFHI